MSHPTEKPDQGDKPARDDSKPAQSTRKSPIWTDRVDEVLVFSDINSSDAKPQEQKERNGK